MATIVVMPQLGNSVESCIIVEWMIAEGDTVSVDQTLASIETDKSTMEVPSTAEGTVLKLLWEEGDEVPVKDPLIIVGAPGEDISGLVPGGDGAPPEPDAPLSADQMYRLQEAPSTATVTIKNGPAPFECTDVTLVSPTSKTQDTKNSGASENSAAASTDLKARCAIPSDQTVFAGLQVNLEMTTGSATGLLAVPVSAVEGRYQTGTVYLPTSDPANPEKRSVTLGLTDGKMVEVKEGLEEGEEILEFTPTATKDNQDDPYGSGDTGGGAKDGAADASDGTSTR